MQEKISCGREDSQINSTISTWQQSLTKVRPLVENNSSSEAKRNKRWLRQDSGKNKVGGEEDSKELSSMLTVFRLVPPLMRERIDRMLRCLFTIRIKAKKCGTQERWDYNMRDYSCTNKANYKTHENWILAILLSRSCDSGDSMISFHNASWTGLLGAGSPSQWHHRQLSKLLQRDHDFIE